MGVTFVYKVLPWKRVEHAVENIRTCNNQLADALAEVARDLQYGQILRLVRAARAETNPEDET